MPAQLTVILPVYNEAATVTEVIERLLALAIVGQVIAVNDGSTDTTARLLAAYQHRSKVMVLSSSINHGKGWAVRQAIPHCREELVVIADADCEYAPEELPVLSAFLLKNEHIAVYGSRFRPGHVVTGVIHRFGNYLLTKLTNLTTGSHLTDSETCYKMMYTKTLQSLSLRADRWGVDSEITAGLQRCGGEIGELPVTYTPRSIKGGKKIRWYHSFIIAATLWRLRMKR